MSIGTLFTLFVLPAVYVVIATDHRRLPTPSGASRSADFDLAPKALKADLGRLARGGGSLAEPPFPFGAVS